MSGMTYLGAIALIGFVPFAVVGVVDWWRKRRARRGRRD
jgi:hypothetical protein